MTALAWFLAYLVVAVVHFLVAVMTRRGGYGSKFGSAGLAIALSIGWPVLWTVLFLEAMAYRMPDWWERVERWWDPS